MKDLKQRDFVTKYLLHNFLYQVTLQRHRYLDMQHEIDQHEFQLLKFDKVVHQLNTMD